MKLQKPPMRSFQRDEEVVRKLSPEQFRVTQRSGTGRHVVAMDEPQVDDVR